MEHVYTSGVLKEQLVTSILQPMRMMVRANMTRAQAAEMLRRATSIQQLFTALISSAISQMKAMIAMATA